MISEHYKIDFVPPQSEFRFSKGKSKRIRDAKQGFNRKYGHEFTANAASEDCHTIQLRLRSGSKHEKDAEKRLYEIRACRNVCLPDLEDDTSSEDSEMTVKDEASQKSPSGKSKQKSTSTTTSDGAYGYFTGSDIMTKSASGKSDDKYSKWDGSGKNGFFMRRRLLRGPKKFQTTSDGHREFRSVLAQRAA